MCIMAEETLLPGLLQETMVLGCSDQEHAPGPHHPRFEGVHLPCTEEALEPTFSLASCDP